MQHVSATGPSDRLVALTVCLAVTLPLGDEMPLQFVEAFAASAARGHLEMASPRHHGSRLRGSQCRRWLRLRASTCSRPRR